MSRPISLSEEDTDTDDYPADNELSSNLPMHAEDDDDEDDKENRPPPTNQHLPPPSRTPPSSLTSSSPIKRPPHKRHRPSSATPSSPCHDANLVLLDIGGVLFKTSRSTLLSIPDTYFTAHLTFTTTPSTTPLFIDRDSVHFRHVLNYMRDRSLPDGLTLRDLNELHREATYYAIDELREQVDRLRVEMGRREEEAERRRETERLLLQASASERQQHMWPNRSLSNPLQSAAMMTGGAAGTALIGAHHAVQRALSTAAADFQLDADF